MTAALSIRQPWAWLIVNGHKPVENRTWICGYRGPLLIHASKTDTEEDYLAAEDIIRECGLAIRLPHPLELQRGGIVGQARLTGCVQRHESPWFFGPHGFVLEDAQPLPFRACRGKLGIFTVVL